MIRALRGFLHLLLALTALQAGAVGTASREEINAEVKHALKEFARQSPAGHELAQKAAGVLVFPSVVKAGMGVGGEYGEGALVIKGKTAAYYNVAGASIGFQLGVQARSQIILFMTPAALADFRRRDGWQAGVDGSVALATLGAGGTLDTETAKQPVIGFMFSNKGLMYNLTFEGSKITRIKR
jgi:lipid-binding SYLF domain-containing protein